MDSLLLLQYTSLFAVGFAVGVTLESLVNARILKKLQKTGRLETKKGTYTFTPKEKTTNE